MLALLVLSGIATAQPAPEAAPEPEPAPGVASGGDIALDPVAADVRIRDRLTRVLRATGGIDGLQVRVDEGVVFVDGVAEDARYVELAGELARNTDGVAAVVNRLELGGAPWDLSPARDEVVALGREAIRGLPLFGVGLAVVVFGWLGGRLARSAAKPVLRRRIGAHLLADVAATAVGAVVFLLGVYLALRIGGLTRLAATVIGGTGLVGLVVGIAFRGITENFLASLFLSVQRPFREGDLVEITGITGYVQRLTTRTTLLTTLDGTQVQIPNATVFNSVIRNWTSSPNRREDFVVGIGYDAAVPDAQRVAMAVLREHPAVLADPEPWVLVDRLGAATVDLRVYFWLDGSRHSWLKVRSSVIRLVKRALQDAAISLPDESREVVFPDGVPVRWAEDGAASPEPRPVAPPEGAEASGEAGLGSDAATIDAQARQAWVPDEGRLSSER